jgi:hypothetical protein
MGGQRRDDVFGVAVHAAQRVGGERPLELQPEVDQAGVSGRDATGVQRQPLGVEDAQGAEVAQVGTIAGGEQDGVYLLACAIRPDDAVGAERGEHGAAVHLPGLQGVAVLAGVDHPPVAEVVAEPLWREQVEAAGH